MWSQSKFLIIIFEFSLCCFATTISDRRPPIVVARQSSPPDTSSIGRSDLAAAAPRGDVARPLSINQDEQLSAPTVTSRDELVVGGPETTGLIGNSEQVPRLRRQSKLIKLSPTKQRPGTAEDAEDELGFIKVAPNVQTNLNQQRPPTTTLSSLRRTTTTTADSVTTADDEDVAWPVAEWQQQQRLPKKHPPPRARGTEHADVGQHSPPIALAPASLATKSSPRISGSRTAKLVQSEQQSASPNNNNNDNQLARLYLDLPQMALEVRAHVGETAYLMCRLRAHVGQQQQHAAHSTHEPTLQVSWVRNMQILTSGEFRYTSDERFKPNHLANTNDWLLEIHNVQPEDEGQYECQVNSEPKPASVIIELRAIVAQVEILEAPEVQLDGDADGPELRLTCRVEFRSQAQLKQMTDKQLLNEQQEESTSSNELAGDVAQERPVPANSSAKRLNGDKTRPIERRSLPVVNHWSKQHYIYWYKDNTSLEYNYPRGNVQVERRDLPDGNLESVLKLGGKIEPADQGLYKCKLFPESNEVQPARVNVRLSRHYNGFGFGSSSSTSTLLARRSSLVTQRGHLEESITTILVASLLENLSLVMLTSLAIARTMLNGGHVTPSTGSS